jgi:hypothetical protein
MAFSSSHFSTPGHEVSQYDRMFFRDGPTPTLPELQALFGEMMLFPWDEFGNSFLEEDRKNGVGPARMLRLTLGLGCKQNVFFNGGLVFVPGPLFYDGWTEQVDVQLRRFKSWLQRRCAQLRNRDVEVQQ